LVLVTGGKHQLRSLFCIMRLVFTGNSISSGLYQTSSVEIIVETPNHKTFLAVLRQL